MSERAKVLIKIACLKGILREYDLSDRDLELLRHMLDEVCAQTLLRGRWRRKDE